MSGIAVKGMGAVCSAGYGVDTGFDAVVDGRDGLSPLSVLDSELKQTPLCGEVAERPQTRLATPVADPTTGFAVWSAQEALGDIHIPGNMRLGLVLATTVAGITSSEQFYRVLRESPEAAREAPRHVASHEPTATAGSVARTVGAQGFHSLSTACSTGLHAVGMAKRLVEEGLYDLCLAVGSDALSILTVRGFASLMLVDFDGCKPFDKRRVGISLGEGAGALLLASDSAAEKLGKDALARVCGWGASADAHHMTAPHPDGLGARKAMEKALAQAGVQPGDVGLVAAHGTATPDNDVAEVKALREMFPTIPPFCSMKRTLGHTLAASGALEAVFCIEAIRRGVIPATGGFGQVDEAIGLSPSPRVNADIRYAVKNSFGFGGNNAAVVFGKAQGAA